MNSTNSTVSCAEPSSGGHGHDGYQGSLSAEPCPETLVDIVLTYSVGSLLIFIIFMSISGNLLVCMAIYTDRRLRKLSNVFLASLAVADLFLASLVMTFAVANDLMGYWVFGDQFCETWIALDVMCCTASIVNLCAISLDRFIHIKNPLRYEQWMSKRVVMAAVTSIWTLAGLVSFVPVGFGWHKPTVTEPLPSVLGDHEGHLGPQCALDLTPLYAVVSSCISFILPCIIMIALYTRLYLYARKHVKNIKSYTKPMHQPLAMDQTNVPLASGDNHGHHSHRQRLKDHKAAITLGIIMGVFLFCWVPFFCMNIIAAFCKTCVPLSVFKVLTWLGYFNSTLNPIIYSIFNSEFRDAFRRILVSYVRSDLCCDDPETRRSSRSNTDLHGGQLVNGAQRGTGKPHGHGPNVDFFPVASNKIELNFDPSEGKVSDI
ncbi:Dopamine receptor 1 [Halotydeus destructor]|nr:Dopamine receptor 1 [Halotydeus destructor]